MQLNNVEKVINQRLVNLLGILGQLPYMLQEAKAVLAFGHIIGVAESISHMQSDLFEKAAHVGYSLPGLVYIG